MDNGVWFEISYPIWKAPNHKKEKLAHRVEALERRLNELTPQTQ